MTSPTEQMLREIKERLSAADMKQYARHPDYWEMAECELSAHAPEDLAKLLAIVEMYEAQVKQLSDRSMEWDRTCLDSWIIATNIRVNAIAKGDE